MCMYMNMHTLMKEHSFNVKVMSDSFYHPMVCIPLGSSVHGISEAEIVEWVVISSSSGSSWPRDWTHVSCGSCIVGRFFTIEPLIFKILMLFFCCYSMLPASITNLWASRIPHPHSHPTLQHAWSPTDDGFFCPDKQMQVGPREESVWDEVGKLLTTVPSIQWEETLCHKQKETMTLSFLFFLFLF